MENREYFFHKRKYMARMQGASLEDNDDSDDLSNQDENAKDKKEMQSDKIQHTQNIRDSYHKKKLNVTNKKSGFFDNLSTSCNLDNMPKRESL